MDKRKKWIMPCLHKKLSWRLDYPPSQISGIAPPPISIFGSILLNPAYMITSVNRR
jgi:hypothetical protein